MKWPDKVVDVIARRQCVLFLGAGLSMNSVDANGNHPKSWEGFLKSALDDVADKAQKNFVKNAIRGGDYLLACELLKNSLGKDDFIELLKDEFERPRYGEAEIHRNIFNLDSRIVITPNFDKIYDTYAEHASSGTVHVKRYDETDIADALRRNDRLILKMHGSIDAPTNVIFSQKDYAKARTENALFYKIVEALLLTHTFVFIGAGINDPDVRLLLENYSSMFHTAMPHYFITGKKTIKGREKVYSEIFNLKFLTYDEKDNHKELADSIAELVDLVELRRSVIADQQNW